MRTRTRWAGKADGAGQLAALIDVVFLLLIFFVATTVPAPREAHVSVNLPGTTVAPRAEPRPVLRLGVDPEGYTVMGKPLGYDALTPRLRELGALDPDVTIAIAVRADATEGQLMRLLDACQAAGLHDLSVFMAPRRVG